VITPSKLGLQSLIVFYYVATEESITSAADKLCLTQPTITYHIKSLEETVNLKLLNIRRQKVYLTPAGVGLLSYAREIHQQMVSAEKFLEDLRGANFSIGIAATFGPIVALAAAEFEELHPHVKLIVKNAASFDIADDVLSSQVDLGIVVGMDYNAPRLKAIPISAREKLVLVASPSNPICEKQRIELADLCGYSLIAGPEKSATRQVILERFKAEGLTDYPDIIAEVNNLEWGMSLVESGKGVGLYHMKVVEKEIAEGRLKVLPLVNDIWVGAEALLRTDSHEHPAAGSFISLVKKAFKNRA
jgi:DNA-binding transcriptional LysR family regulator